MEACGRANHDNYVDSTGAISYGKFASTPTCIPSRNKSNRNEYACDGTKGTRNFINVRKVQEAGGSTVRTTRYYIAHQTDGVASDIPILSALVVPESISRFTRRRSSVALPRSAIRTRAGHVHIGKWSTENADTITRSMCLVTSMKKQRQRDEHEVEKSGKKKLSKNKEDWGSISSVTEGVGRTVREESYITDCIAYSARNDVSIVVQMLTERVTKKARMLNANYEECRQMTNAIRCGFLTCLYTFHLRNANRRILNVRPPEFNVLSEGIRPFPPLQPASSAGIVITT
ncbi:hypothetical protein CBL_10415 [Carabus blaptoides fortunei]